MARVRWHGTEFNAQPVRALADGSWEMIALAHTARASPGTTIVVKRNEIVEMAAAEMPAVDNRQDQTDIRQNPSDSAGLSALDAAMAEERKTLPSVQELIGAAREASTLPNPKPEDMAP